MKKKSYDPRSRIITHHHGIIFVTFFRTTEWIRAQISIYFSLSILQPSSSSTATTIHRSWLLCLAHRYFPSSVPDLIIRLKQHNEDSADDHFIHKLFLDHWNIKYTGNHCVFSFVDMIRQYVTQHNLTTPTKNILAGKYHNCNDKKKSNRDTQKISCLYFFFLIIQQQKKWDLYFLYFLKD